MKKVLLFMMLFGINLVYSQVQNITGKVLGANGNPISALIELQDDPSKSTMSDSDGNYSIEAEQGKTIVFSADGMEPKNIVVGNDTKINISLKSMEKLQEVVVTALGIKKEKKALGFAVQELKGKALADTKEPNVTNALAGKVSGLQVIKGSNGPGSSSKLLLRGMTSLTGDNQPLIVVDGIPVSNSTGVGSGNDENSFWTPSLDPGNGLSDINAEDIDNISVLKGPTAAALYGSRAGNGVLLITTKTGRKQKGLGVTFNSSIGFETIFTRPKTQNSFGQGTEGVFNPTSQLSWGPKIDKTTEYTNWLGEKETIKYYDNVKRYYNKPGITQNYGLSFQQLIGKTSVYASINQLKEESYIPGAKVERTNLTTRTSTRFGATEKWTLDMKVQYNRSVGTNRPRGGFDFSQFLVLNEFPTSLDIRTINRNTNPGDNSVYYNPQSTAINPYWAQNNVFNQDIKDRYILSASLKYKITNWLDAEFKPGTDRYTLNTEEKLYGGSITARNGRYSSFKTDFNETNYMFLLNAKKDNLIDKIGATATIGGNLMESKFSRLGANILDLEIPNYFNLINALNYTPIIQNSWHKKVNSVFASTQINYDGWIFLDTTFRNDWSSALIKANRSYFYPSASLSYVVSDMLEKYSVTLPKWINFSKLRFGYSEVGNDMAPYQLFNGYILGKDPLGNTVSRKGDILFDPNIKSESIKNLEFGTELKLLNNRLNIDFTTYKSNSTNQILDIPLDPMSQYISKKINAGSIINKGFEISIDTKILTNPDNLNWSINTNFSKNTTWINKLTPEIQEYVLPGGAYENLKVTNIQGSKFGDIYGTTFLKVTDINSPFYGQRIVDGRGRFIRGKVEYLGNQQAKGLLGITNSFSYKGLNFSFLIDARFGGEIFSASLARMQKAGTAKETVINGQRDLIIADGVKNTGTVANPIYVKNDIQVNPQIYWEQIAATDNFGINEANIYDATNVRLRNIQLSYSIPSEKLKSLMLQRATIGISCNNVWLIHSNMKGLDPESVFSTGTNATGFESGSAPTTRTILFNLSVTF